MGVESFYIHLHSFFYKNNFKEHEPQNWSKVKNKLEQADAELLQSAILNNVCS